jgi:choline kinase
MKAIILAAGMGTRLRPITNSIPKCLVPVNSRPILEHQFEALFLAGIRDVVLVVGHLAELLSDKYGTSYRGMNIHYVENRRYDRTNNIYSLWLAKQHLNSPVLLLEGDLVFEPELLQRLTQTPEPNVAIVERFQPHMDGTVILTNELRANPLWANGLWASRMVLKAYQGADFDYASAFKTVNIYKLSQEVLQDQIVPELDSYVAQQRYDQYYEAVFADLISRDAMRLAVLSAAPDRWAEVDTLEDLQAAEELFAKEILAPEKARR